METKIVERASETRCYKCGNTQITGVCHHCGRALCDTHKSQVKDVMGQLTSLEFFGLGLEGTRCGEGALHCEYCDHIVKKPSNLVLISGLVIATSSLGLLLLLFILTVFWLRDGTGLVLVLLIGSFAIVGLVVGGGLAYWGYRIRRDQISNLTESRPPVPVLPRLDRLSARETLHATVILDGSGHYQISAPQTEGVLEIILNFGKPERDRFQLYLNKFRPSVLDDVWFNAGFAVLRGPASIWFADQENILNNSGTVIHLYDWVAEQPVLNGTANRGSSDWRITKKYFLVQQQHSGALPLRLVPSLVHEAARRALDLELQWKKLNPLETKLKIARIDLLELQVPASWGEVESVSDGALIGVPTSVQDKEVAVRSIVWRNLSITEKEVSECRRTFFARFENTIDVSSILHGRVETTFKGALSQIEDIELYYPLGGKREDDAAEIETRVTADFDLSLAGLRYQDIRVVPDPKKEKDGDKQQIMTFDGVIPNHNTVAALTNAMSTQRFYVQRVIENPPRTGERANLVNRYWDIAGRRYDGVYPIDFHLVLTGEEILGGDARVRAGITKTSLTVQGAFANDDMETLIANVWEELNYLIELTMGKLPHIVPSTNQALRSPLGTEQITPPSRQKQGRTDSEERLGALRKRLDQLTDALIAGRLSEQVFLELKASIENEIRDLDISQ